MRCLWPRWCSGRRRARPPARLGVLTSFVAAPRSPPVPSGPSGALHTGGAGCAGVCLCVGSKPYQAPPPPVGTVARRAGPSGVLHTGGACAAACGLVRVVTNVVNPMAFSLKMVVFGLGLTTFVTGVLMRRFELRWFDDVCNVGRPLAARPGPVATAQVSRPDLTCRIAETAPNFARNSPATISNIEFRSLELQRFRAL